jgi:hypothetical protein
MAATALTCPQCAAPLPTQAQWRLLTCAYCGASVRISQNLVQRSRFRESRQAALAAAEAVLPAGRTVAVCGQRYRVLRQFASAAHSAVFLAQRISPLPELVTLKLAYSIPTKLLAEAAILRKLQQISVQGASFFTQLLPQAIGCGQADLLEFEQPSGTALVLRHPAGFWGSLAQVLRYQPHGIDPRHVVWIWRRMLDTLAFVHQAGWVHGNVCLEHFLVHPRDHGIQIIGWSGAQYLPESRFNSLQGLHTTLKIGPWRDVMQTACCIRIVLAGSLERDAGFALGMPILPASVPDGLARLIRQASEDPAWCAKMGAKGLNQQLHEVALAAFGPPQFLKFKPGLF